MNRTQISEATLIAQLHKTLMSDALKAVQWGADNTLTADFKKDVSVEVLHRTFATFEFEYVVWKDARGPHVDIYFDRRKVSIQDRLRRGQALADNILRGEALMAATASQLTIKMYKAQRKHLKPDGTVEFVWESIIWFGGAFYAIAKDAYAHKDEAKGILETQCSTRIGTSVLSVNVWIHNMYGG